jgi:hypothetical protein
MRGRSTGEAVAVLVGLLVALSALLGWFGFCLALGAVWALRLTGGW